MSVLNDYDTFTNRQTQPQPKVTKWRTTDLPKEVCEIHRPTFNEKLSDLYNQAVTKVLTNILPHKTKRLFFIASLIASIKNIKDPDDNILVLINQKFDLSDSREALALPVWVGVKLWFGRVPKNLCLQCNDGIPLINLADLDGKRLTPGEMRVAANSVINCAPNWIKYGSRRTMRNDFVSVLEFVQSLE